MKLKKIRAQKLTYVNVIARIENVKARLKNVKTRLGNVRLKRSFLKADKAKHLQLHLPGCCNNQVKNSKKTEYQ